MIILTAIANYTINDIKPFVNSLIKSGYKDRKIALVYNLTSDTIQYLQDNEWELYNGELQEHIILQRFKDGYYLLNNSDTISDFETILWVDIKDIIFQRNPKEWLDRNQLQYNKKLMAFSECIKLQDDDWATLNCGTSFPMEWESVKNSISYCAGIIAGEKKALGDLFLEIYRWEKTKSNPNQLADQAAYNILLRLEHFKNTTEFINQSRGFVTNLGTVLIKKDFFGNRLIEPTPSFKNGKFYDTESDIEFYVVHQYDRDQKIKKDIINAYID